MHITWEEMPDSHGDVCTLYEVDPAGHAVLHRFPCEHAQVPTPVSDYISPWWLIILIGLVVGWCVFGLLLERKFRIMPIVHIDQWFRCDIYGQHQDNGNHLCGIVTGHPFVEDGHRAVTSQVIEQWDGKVKTRTGTMYVLGVQHTFDKDSK